MRVLTVAPRISVVIPTYRRPELLTRCLAALAAQSLSHEAFEVIVVDDGRSAETRAVCAGFGVEPDAPLQIRYLVPHGTRGPAAARNRGWRAATARLIAFTDDDTIPDPGWLQAACAALQAPERVAVWGRVIVPRPTVMTDNARNTAGLEDAVFVTANVCVRRRALAAVEGFDERYRRAWREDTDLYFALLALAPWPGAVAAAPEAVVLHPVREAKFLVSIGQQANMAFDALLYKKYPTLYDAHVGVRHPPLEYAVIVVATLLALVCLPMSAAAAAVCALLTLTLILRFAARRLRGLSHSPRQVTEMLLSSAAIPYVSLWWRFSGAVRWRARFY